MTPDQFSFDEIARVLPEAVLLVSGEGKVLYVNPPATQSLGLPAERISGQMLWDLVTDPQASVQRYLGLCSRSRQMMLGAFTWRGQDGQVVACRCAGAVLRPWTPAAPALILLRLRLKESASTRFNLLNKKIEELNKEIHARQQAQAQLQKREAELRALNETLEHKVFQRTEELLLSNERLREREAVVEQVNLELRQLNQELQDFAHVASHDLKEPLRKIRIFADLIHLDYGTQLDEPGRDLLERIQAAASRMMDLINSLLAFSRVATKGQAFEEVDLEQIARDVLLDLELQIKETGGEVVLGHLPKIQADPTQMRQLLQNLIGNAIKFHHKGVAPRVKLKTQFEPDASVEGSCTLRLIVEDNGIGFDEKYLDKIFSPFQRLHGRSEFEGTGMGLAICRRIVERHGGTITAQSTPGEGSRFIITLPVGQLLQPHMLDDGSVQPRDL